MGLEHTNLLAVRAATSASVVSSVIAHHLRLLSNPPRTGGWAPLFGPTPTTLLMSTRQVMLTTTTRTMPGACAPIDQSQQATLRERAACAFRGGSIHRVKQGQLAFIGSLAAMHSTTRCLCPAQLNRLSKGMAALVASPASSRVGKRSNMSLDPSRGSCVMANPGMEQVLKASGYVQAAATNCSRLPLGA